MQQDYVDRADGCYLKWVQCGRKDRNRTCSGSGLLFKFCKRILPKAGSIRKTRDGNFVVSRLSYLGTASYIVDDMINKGSNYYRCYNPLFMNLEIEKNYPLLKKTYEEIQKCISQEDWLIN